MPKQYFVDVNPALFQGKRCPMRFVRFWLTSSCTSFRSAVSTAFDDSAWSGCCQSGRLQSSNAAPIWKPSIEVTETALKVIANGSTLIPPHKLPEKRRNYFSPDEIGAIQILLAKRPELFGYWNVPMSLQEVQNGCR